MPLLPDVEAVLRAVGLQGLDALLPADESPAALAASLAALRVGAARPVADDDPVAARSETTARGVPLRVYRVASDRSGTLPIVLFLHGGGWVIGDLETNDRFCRRIARAGFVVVSVDYRLAPEHPFPAALDDGTDALDWVTSAAERLGGDASRIVLFGCSAGGNLAGAMAMRASARGDRVAAQVLAYPVIDSRQDSRSYRENARGYFLTARQMAWFWDQYVPDPDRRNDPLASLAHAESLVGAPPTIVVTAEFDVLRDEGDGYAARLSADGARVEHLPVPGVIHGFLTLEPAISVAEPTLVEILDRLRDILARLP